MGRTVVLRHDLPDGTHHFDWLLDPTPGAASAGEDPDERALISWRLGARPDGGGTPVLPAERMAPHRRLYLEYEGPVSGGRGVVVRVAEGWAEVVADRPERFEAVAEFGSGVVRVRGERGAGGGWVLRVSDEPRG